MRLRTQLNLALMVNGLAEKSLDSELTSNYGTTYKLDDTPRFWLNAIESLTSTTQRRFIDAFQHYTDSVVQQAADRDHSYIRSIERYLELRRDTVGAKPSFAIIGAKMDIPDDVISHPTIVALTMASIDMIIIGNDLCSYNIE